MFADYQWTSRVVFFANDGQAQPMFDGRIIQFNSSPELPAPPRRFLYEHFKQAVLANMKGAGQPRDFDFDETEDAQRMSVFETGFGKEWLETKLADRLLPYSEDNQDPRNGDLKQSKRCQFGMNENAATLKYED